MYEMRPFGFAHGKTATLCSNRNLNVELSVATMFNRRPDVCTINL
ncbi:MAG: hypothetical protein JWQ40_5030 [Segetibacter sp.]|nr:hypothetical protein [Segetibacter sp.]